MSRKRKRKVHPSSEPQTLAPETTPSEPSPTGSSYIHMPRRIAGMYVDEITALTCATVWACVKLISEDIAGLPFNVYERRASGNGSDARPDDPADWLISMQANPETTAFTWKEITLTHALTKGNGYSEIEFDMAGRPMWLWQITPDRVCVERDSRGRIVYDVRNDRAPNTVLDMDEVFHLKGLGYDGLVGYDVIRFHARTIGACMAADTVSGDLYANDSTPGGILKTPKRLKPEAVKNLRESWNKMHAGPQNRRRLAILEDGLEWFQTALDPQTMQLVETMQLTPAMICRIFRVSPVKVADLLRATFSNVEELGIWHVSDTLLPWGRRLETEGNIKLFGRTNRGRRFCKLNFKGLLRGSIANQTVHINNMLDRGVYDINEAREFLDLNPIGTDGDKRFVPLNMQLLEKAGEEPEPPPEPMPTEPEPDMPVDEGDETEGETNTTEGEPNAMQSHFHKGWLAMMTTAISRVQKREEQERLEMEGKNEEWLAKCKVRHGNYIEDIVGSVMKAYSISLCGSAEPVEMSIKVYVRDQTTLFHKDLPEPRTPEQIASQILASVVFSVRMNPPLPEPSSNGVPA